MPDVPIHFRKLREPLTRCGQNRNQVRKEWAFWRFANARSAGVRKRLLGAYGVAPIISPEAVLCPECLKQWPACPKIPPTMIRYHDSDDSECRWNPCIEQGHHLIS